MISCSSQYLKALQSPVKQLHLKLEFYSNSMQYLYEITKDVTSDIGTLSIDINRPVKRSFSFTLDNSDGRFTFGSDKTVWLNKYVKLFLGLTLANGTIEYIPQGVFRLSDLSDSNGVDGKKSYITGVDKMSRYTDKIGMFSTQLTIATGTNIATAIKLIAKDETMFNFDPITKTTPFELVFQIGSSKYEAMKQLADLAQVEIFYDENGYMRLKNISLNDISNYPPVWSFKYSDKSERFYAGNVRKLDETNIANRIVVLGGNSDTPTAYYELVVDETNPLWVGHPYSIQQIGDRLFQWNNGSADPVITTNAEAKNRAKWCLMKYLGYSQQVSLNIAPHWLLDAGDIIEITDDSNDVSGRYLINSINMPLQPQQMSCECSKEIQVISDWDFI